MSQENAVLLSRILLCSFFAATEGLEMPNSGYMFRLANASCIMAPENDGSPLMPALTIYQDWEDYRNGVDTVLEYILVL